MTGAFPPPPVNPAKVTSIKKSNVAVAMNCGDVYVIVTNEIYISGEVSIDWDTLRVTKSTYRRFFLPMPIARLRFFSRVIAYTGLISSSIERRGCESERETRPGKLGNFEITTRGASIKQHFSRILKQYYRKEKNRNFEYFRY